MLALLALSRVVQPGGPGMPQGGEPSPPTPTIQPLFLPRYLQQGTMSGDGDPYLMMSGGGTAPFSSDAASPGMPPLAWLALAILGLCIPFRHRLLRSRTSRRWAKLAIIIAGIMVLSGMPFAPAAAVSASPALPGPRDNFGIRPGMEGIAPLVEINSPAPGALVGPFMDVTVVFAAFKANGPDERSSFAFNGREVPGKNVGDVQAVRLYVFTSFEERVAPVAIEWKNTPQAKQGEHTFEAVSLAPFTAGATIIVCAVAFQGQPNSGIGRSTCMNLEVKQTPRVECLFGPETFYRTKGQPRVETRSVTVTSRVEGPYTLYVFNGAPDGKNRVSSGSVRLNGEEVVSPHDLSQQVGAFEREVTLESGRNVLEVEVRLESKPGSFLTLTLCGFLRAAPPSITIITPAAASVVPTSTPDVRVDYAAGDEQPESRLDLTTLRVVLDGIDITALLVVAGNTAFGAVDAAHALAEAPHQLEASIATVSGVSAEATSPFTVDLPPSVEITAEPGHVFVEQPVFLTVRAHDNLGLIGLHVTVDDEPIELDVPVNEGSVTRDVVAHGTFVPRIAGPHIPEAVAIDTSGNTAMDRDDFTALPASAADIQVTVGAQPRIQRVGFPVALSVSVTSTVEVTSVSLSVEGRSVPLNRENVGTFVPNREGTFIASVIAQDAELHVATASTTFRAVSEDIVLPTVVVTAVPSIQRVNSPVLLIVKAADNVNVAGLGLTVEGIVVPLDEEGRGTFVSPTPATFEAVGTVVDPFGKSASASTTFQVVDESSGADLVALSMNMSGAAADPQTLVLSGTVSVSFENGGSVHIAPGFEVAVFEDLNLDGTFSTDEDHLFGAVTVDDPVLAGERSQATVPMFGQLRFRENVLLAMVDARQVVPETDEANNIVRSLMECDESEGERACLPPPQGLVSWWPADNHPNDIVDANHGTLRNGAAFGTGMVGPAFSFDGVDDYMTTRSISLVGDFTFETWIRAQVPQYVGTIVKLYPTTPYLFFAVYQHRVYVEGASTFSGTTTVDDDAWHHVALTRAGNTYRIYVDGRLESTASGSTASISQVLEIGGLYSNWQFKGLIDELTLYNRALTDSEIQGICSAESGGKCRPLAIITTALPDGVLGKPYFAALEAVGGTPPYTWDLASGTLPPGLSLQASSGHISGSPTTEGTFTFAVQVRDSTSATSAREFVMRCAACIEPPSGLVSWWPANGSAEDAMGTNHGSLQNGATYGTGKVWQAFSFDGVDDHARIPDAPALNPAAAITLEAWIKSSGCTHYYGWCSIITKSPNGQARDFGYGLLINSQGRIGFVNGDGVNWFSTYQGPSLFDDAWHHIAATYGDGVVTYHVDGVQVFSTTNSVPLTANTSQVEVGAESGEPGYAPFRGFIDEVTLYDRALSNSEIQAIFDADSRGKCKPQPLPPVRSRTYTLDEDFDEGILVGVNHDAPNHDQLQLNKVTTRFPFIWVAASGKGTVVKISTETGAVLGEYLSAPNGRGRNPSRTTVDLNGNVWVANRDEYDGGRGSVVRIGLLENHQCVDRNRNGVIDTSTGLGDIRPWLNPSGVDSNGGVSSAQDECIINYTRVTGTGTRTVAVDANNDVWVGGLGDLDHEKLSGITGAPFPGTQFNLGCGGYGGVIDGNGVLWSARGSGALLRFVPNATPPPAGSGQCLGGRGDYGLAIDPANGHIWHTFLEGNRVAELDSEGRLLHVYGHGYYYAQGVVVDGRGNVWVANSLYGSTVGHLRTDGTFVGNVNVGSGPTGVSVDTNGKVWATNYNSWNVVRIDPDAGPLGGGGYRVGAVDLTVGLGSNAYPYNYSDMTGGVLFGAVVGRGTWTVIHDSKAVGTNWGSVSWTSDEPPGTLVQARARSAGTVSGLSGSTYVDAPNGADIEVPDGRYLQVELTLLANAAGERPIVFDVTLRAGCEQDLTASRLAADQGGCPAQVSLSAVVGSGGAVPIPAATPVAFYDGDPASGGTLIGTTQTSRELLAGDSETVTIVWSSPPPGQHRIFVVADDDGTGARSLAEESNFVNNIAIMVRNICVPDPPPPVVLLVVPEEVQRTEESILVTVDVPVGFGAGEVVTGLEVVSAADPGFPLFEVTLQDRGTFQIPFLFHTAGEYRFTAEATDSLGRVGSATAAIVVEAGIPTDNILPVVIILHVDGGPFVVGEAKGIAFVAEDNDAVASVTVVEDTATFTFLGGGPFSLSVSPDAPGDYRVMFTAEDRSGNRASFVLSAIALDPEAPGPLPPLLTVQLDPDTIFPGESSAIRVEAVDPQGQTVTVTVKVGDELVPVIGGVALYKSSPLYYGEFPVLVTATNTSGLTSRVTGVLHILNPGDNAPPSVGLSVDSTPAIVGESITFQVFGFDESGTPRLSLTVGGVDQPLDTNGIARYTSATPGVFQVVATATDSGGRRATVETSVEFLPLPDDILPVGDLGSLAYDTVVSEPVDIVGTATDEHFARYFLQYARQGDVGFTTFASGTEPVIDSLLGTFDPTTLINDRYTVQLVVLDERGHATISSTEVTVSSDVKLGNFTLTFGDMTVDAAGLPVTVERTYDSRDKQMGDFGVSWTLSIADFDLREDEARNVTLTMPDSRRVTFYFDLVNCGYFFVYVCANWQAEPGVFATLTMEASSNRVLFDSLNGVLVWFEDDPSVSYDCYQVPGYRLTLKDGTRYFLEKSVLGFFDEMCGGVFVPTLGDAVLESVTDRNGNTLSFTHDGILHSAGKSVLFTRDAEGRITVITDPNGEQILYRYDAEGDLVGVTDQEGNETTFEYRPNHLLVNILDPLGRIGIRNEYDDTGRLVAHVDGEGNRIEYTHLLDTRQEVVKDRLGNLTVYEYDARGDVVSMTDGLGGRTEYAYDANRNEILMRDPLGRATTRVYDPQGNLLFENDTMGNRRSWTYNARGQVLTYTDALGHGTTNQYDANGNLLREVDALGNVTTHEYDAMGNLVQNVDAMGKLTLYEYDAFGYMTSTRDALGSVTAYTYDANGNRLTVTRTRTLPDGTAEALTTIFMYDGAGRLVATANPDGSVRHTEYDELGRPSARIDELVRRTESQYDARGYLSATLYPDGTRETFAYDVEGRQISQTDRGGRTTLMDYDVLGRLVRTTSPDGTSTSITYDAKGNILTQTDERGNVVTFAYDALDRQVSITDALGNTTKSEYDANGNLVATVDALGRRTTYQYDAKDRRVRTVFPDTTFTTTSYDPLGRRTAETNQAGKTTQFGYDALSRLTGVIDALLQSWSHAYDEVGNMTLQTDANGNTTRFEYNQLGRQSARVLPLGQRETLGYDPVGNLVSKTDFNGSTIIYAYDVNNRLILRQYEDGTSHVFTYTATGRRASVTDARGITSYTYDVRDRLLRVTHPDGATLSYTYDACCNLLSVTTPSGTTAYTYDALNRLQSVTDSDGRVTTYVYDAVGNRSGVDYPNGTRTRYTYDDLNRLTLMRHERADGTVFSSFAYTLGSIGNRVRVVENTGRMVEYRYDDVSRLVEEVITDPATAVSLTTYSYDPVGNRLTKTNGLGTVTYVYDADDRLLVDGGVTSTYDDKGNTLSKTSGTETTTYGYDDENSLVRLEQSSGAVTTYAYDADGLRVRKTDATGTTNFLVDMNSSTGFAQVMRETDDVGGEVVRYAYGDDLVSQSRGTATTYYHYDGQMSTRQLTSMTGGVIDSYTYDAFGNLLVSMGSTPNQYLYGGEQYEANAGFYYLRARYYNPSDGRFLTTDPATGSEFDPPSLHKYVYTRNNPVDNLDPSGRTTLQELMIIPDVLRGLAQPAYPTLNTNFSRWGTAIVFAAFERWRDPFGQAYNRIPSWFYSRNNSLSTWQEAYPEGEGKVDWGVTWTCNIFVYDVLHTAGADPPLNSRRHYYSAQATHQLHDDLRDYLRPINGDLVLPGDIWTVNWHADVYHMEIVLTAPDDQGNFWSMGAHETGVDINNKSIADLGSYDLKFYRVI